MKIIHLVDYFQPKLGYQEIFLARKQLEMGHDVFIITSDRYFPYKAYKETVGKILGSRYLNSGLREEEGIKVYRLKCLFEYSHRVWLKGLVNIISKIRPDVIHVHSMTTITAVRIALLKKRYNFQLIYDDHMHFSVLKMNFLKKSFYFIFRHFFTPILVKFGNEFVGITDDARQIMNKVYGVPLSLIKIIPLGVDTNLFRFDIVARQEIRKQYDILDDDIVFIYAGKMIPEKGPHLLLKAGLEAMKKYNRIKLFFLGNGPENYLKQLKNLVKSSDWQNNVIWHDAVLNSELFKYYSASDVGVWPLEESISMLEAAACRLPIIIKDSPGIKDRISWNNGLTYKENNILSLKNCIERFANDENLRRQMGENGRRMIEKEFSWDVIAKKFLDLYSKKII